MELFSKENQTEPLTMLADVIRLYAITHQVSFAQARKDIKQDLKHLNNWTLR